METNKRKFKTIIKEWYMGFAFHMGIMLILGLIIIVIRG